MPRSLIAGNWKMNGMRADLARIEAVRDGLGETGAEVVICPPATLVAAAAERARGSALSIGGQDCHPAASGAHTGDVSAEMLADAGARHVIVGHSERRADHGETDAVVRAKAEAAVRAGLTAIVCVGETEAERDAGEASAVVERQLSAALAGALAPASIVVAYEPVWAIGTGRTPTEDDVARMHAAMRRVLVSRYGVETGSAVRLLYGGSVKPANAATLLAVAEVDGALVGGASLEPGDFLGIVAAVG